MLLQHTRQLEWQHSQPPGRARKWLSNGVQWIVSVVMHEIFIVDATLPPRPGP
jgi:hypothetical protein